MEKYHELFLKSKKTFNTADHLTYITYPLIKDVKVIISITENIYLSVVNAMDSLIEYDILYKRIGPQPSGFDSRFEIFKSNLKERYGIEKEYIDLIKNLRDIITCNKGNYTTLMKENRLYIYSSDFRTKSLDVEELKNFLVKTKKFINKLGVIYKL